MVISNVVGSPGLVVLLSTDVSVPGPTPSTSSPWSLLTKSTLFSEIAVICSLSVSLPSSSAFGTVFTDVLVKVAI